MKLYVLLKAEIRRSFQEIKHYYLETFSNMIITYLFFLGIFWAFAENSNSKDMGTFFIIALLLWYYTQETINQMCHYVTEEKYFGTIEQLFLSPFGSIKLFGARALSNLFYSTAVALGLMILMGISVGIGVPFISLSIIIVAIVTIIGLYGFGYALAGLTIISSRTTNFAAIITYLLLIVTGIIVPISNLPLVVQYISKFLPLTFGIETIRFLSVGQTTFWEIIKNGMFLKLIIHSLASLSLGVIIFYYADERARKKGVVKRY